MSHLFEVMTAENAAIVSMNNPITGIGSTVHTGNDPKSVAYAVMCFARSHGLYPFMVETSVQYPSQRAAQTAPSNALPIGSTVHIRTMGKRKPAVAHTIESYFIGADGTWQFKARDFAGWVHIDSVDTLTP